eukprot:c4337_g1_i1 orf=99-362(-)
MFIVILGLLLSHDMLCIDACCMWDVCIVPKDQSGKFAGGKVDTTFYFIQAVNKLEGPFRIKLILEKCSDSETGCADFFFDVIHFMCL